MQSLYEWDFNGGLAKKVDFDSILGRNIRNSGIDPETDKFIFELRVGLIKHLPEIDKLITENAPEWPLEQIARIDRCILRIGIYELVFSSEVPPKVAIDEAVELAKAFGGPNSSKFVNGVLGAIFRKSEKYKTEAQLSPKTKKEALNFNSSKVQKGATKIDDKQGITSKSKKSKKKA